MCAQWSTFTCIGMFFFSLSQHLTSLFPKIILNYSIARRFIGVWTALTHFQIHDFFVDRTENVFVNCHLAWWIPGHTWWMGNRYTLKLFIFLNNFSNYFFSFLFFAFLFIFFFAPSFRFTSLGLHTRYLLQKQQRQKSVSSNVLCFAFFCTN